MQMLRPASAGRTPAATAQQGRTSRVLGQPAALWWSGGRRAAASSRPRQLPTAAAAPATRTSVIWFPAATQLAVAAAARAGSNGSDASVQEPSFWSLKPVATHVNMVVAGSHQYVGRAAPSSTKEEAVEGEQEQQDSNDGKAADGAGSAKTTPAVDTTAYDEHAAFLADPDAWASLVEPINVPEAGRELLFRFQVRHGHAGIAC